MKQRFTIKNIGFALLFIFIVMQFFHIEKDNPSSDPLQDFIAINHPDDELAQILKTSCYDCHSNRVIYPWYTNIAPVSWWIKKHIIDGREELNFSVWGTYKERRKDKKLKESIEKIKEGEMPLNSYTWIHKQSKLSDIQKEKLYTFFTSLRNFESDKPKQ